MLRIAFDDNWATLASTMGCDGSDEPSGDSRGLHMTVTGPIRRSGYAEKWYKLVSQARAPVEYLPKPVRTERP